MYDVKVTNDYHFGLTVALGGENIAPGGGSAQFKDWGTTYITVPGTEDILFIDLGDTKIPEYTNPEIPWTEKTWGGLIRYRGVEAYFRYEGQGQVAATVNNLGSLELHFDQGGMLVSLPNLVIT